MTSVRGHSRSRSLQQIPLSFGRSRSPSPQRMAPGKLSRSRTAAFEAPARLAGAKSFTRNNRAGTENTPPETPPPPSRCGQEIQAPATAPCKPQWGGGGGGGSARGASPLQTAISSLVNAKAADPVTPTSSPFLQRALGTLTCPPQSSPPVGVPVGKLDNVERNHVRRNLNWEAKNEVTLKKEFAIAPELHDSPFDMRTKVMVRVRPLSSKEQMEGAERVVLQEDNTGLRLSGMSYTFDAVAGEDASQEAMFEMVGRPIVENGLAGFNSSIFAYGQTGSGKTHTMMGRPQDLTTKPTSERGLTPRVFEYMFARIREEEGKNAGKEMKFSAKCSFLEIYNEQITDLLEPSQRNLQIREDVKTGVYVENLSEESVESVEQVLKLIVKGISNRKVAATSMNAESSRSHSVFTCVLQSCCKTEADGTVTKFSRLNLVDLAGSERQKLTGASGERLKEAANINRSLLLLGNVIKILADVSMTGKQRHIPYRDSRLTFLLNESLGGNAKTVMICNISPSSTCAGETLSTLKFAQRARNIQNKAVINEDVTGDVNVLRAQIRRLKEELNRYKAAAAAAVSFVPRPDDGCTPRRDEMVRASIKAIMEEMVRPPVAGLEDDRTAPETVVEDADDVNLMEDDEDGSVIIHDSKEGGWNFPVGVDGQLSSNSGSAWSSAEGALLSPNDDVVLFEEPPSQLEDAINGCKWLDGEEGKDAVSAQNLVGMTDVYGGSPSQWKLHVKDEGKSEGFQLTADEEPSQCQIPRDDANFARLRNLLSGALRREARARDELSHTRAENEQLLSLVDQYKHEKECNDVLLQCREEKIARLEAFSDGVISTDSFLGQECDALQKEVQILQERLDNNMEVIKVKLENHQMMEELSTVRAFCKDGERESLLGELEDLREQLVELMEGWKGSAKDEGRDESKALVVYTGAADDDHDNTATGGDMPDEEMKGREGRSNKDSDEEDANHLEEKATVKEALREQVDLYIRQLEDTQEQVLELQNELEKEKEKAEDAQQALEAAMTMHTRLLESHSDLEQQHLALLDKQRAIRERMEEIVSRAADQGLSAAESQWLESHVAELGMLGLDRAGEDLQREVADLKEQLKDSAGAIQAAGHLVTKLKEAEESIVIAQDAQAAAEQKVAQLEREFERAKRRHATDVATLEQRLREARFQRAMVCQMCMMADRVHFDFPEADPDDATPDPSPDSTPECSHASGSDIGDSQRAEDKEDDEVSFDGLSRRPTRGQIGDDSDKDGDQTADSVEYEALANCSTGSSNSRMPVGRASKATTDSDTESDLNQGVWPPYGPHEGNWRTRREDEE